MSDPVDPSLPEIKPREFTLIRDFVHATFGLDLRQGKERLVSARLGKQLRAGGFRSFEDYFRHVQTDRSGNSLVALIDALTTNHTAFLREPEHFRFLARHVAPEFSRRDGLTVWSAASSTGEEPYSILFTLLETPGVSQFGVRVLGTDISTRVLAHGREGVYPLDKLGSLPPGWLQKYFQRNPHATSSWQVKQEYRSMLEFRRLNLMDPIPASFRFPAIFCRNVMIYFNKATQESLVNRLTHALEPGGYLFVGHSESLTGIDHSLQYVKPAVYRRKA